MKTNYPEAMDSANKASKKGHVFITFLFFHENVVLQL